MFNLKPYPYKERVVNFYYRYYAKNLAVISSFDFSVGRKSAVKPAASASKFGARTSNDSSAVSQTKSVVSGRAAFCGSSRHGSSADKRRRQSSVL